jgi:hypothetical protein
MRTEACNGRTHCLGKNSLSFSLKNWFDFKANYRYGLTSFDDFVSKPRKTGPWDKNPHRFPVRKVSVVVQVRESALASPL